MFFIMISSLVLIKGKKHLWMKMYTKMQHIFSICKFLEIATLHKIILNEAEFLNCVLLLIMAHFPNQD